MHVQSRNGTCTRKPDSHDGLANTGLNLLSRAKKGPVTQASQEEATLNGWLPVMDFSRDLIEVDPFSTFGFHKAFVTLIIYIR